MSQSLKFNASWRSRQFESPLKGTGIKHGGNDRRGFTLVEMVGSLIIISILALVALPRFVGRDAFDAHAFHDQALAMLRYAQKIAIAQNRNVFVRLNGANIAACFDQACTLQVPAPSGKNSGGAATLASCGNATWFCEAVPNGVNFPAVPDFFFNALGQPFNAGPPVSTFAGLNIAIAGGGLARNIVVEPETGYVHP